MIKVSNDNFKKWSSLEVAEWMVGLDERLSGHCDALKINFERGHVNGQLIVDDGLNENVLRLSGIEDPDVIGIILSEIEQIRQFDGEGM